MLAQVNRVAFELFGLQIYWYAIIIVSGIAIALWLSTREALRVGLKEDDMSNFLLWALPIAIIGARLYYVLFDLPMYLADPIQIFNTQWRTCHLWRLDCGCDCIDCVYPASFH